ncbi:hypothetical protein K435DRAFT_423895 [Dendrothele bispora CBS 962.96]|uniref:Uncharacterized protein n=1 Tax=Dendrothele bispora (strain CBS 962.96) TaxID=1314807 RepID=A0A4S8L5I4_DENBC|nr:hypothetical protein K435DRAFT_423895 [Dendrothele bispora CBS 962.96]
MFCIFRDTHAHSAQGETRSSSSSPKIRIERISLLLSNPELPLAEDTDSAKLRIVLTDGSKKLYRTEYCEKADEDVWRSWDVDIEIPYERFTAEVKNRKTLCSRLLAIAEVNPSRQDPANNSNTLSERLMVLKPDKWAEMSIQFHFSKLFGNTPPPSSQLAGSSLYF